MNRITKVALAIILIGLSVALGIYFKPRPSNLDAYVAVELMDNYSKNVQPIFDGKCIACHSCYNSPCQLNLTSFEGLRRGASQINLYDFPKVKPRDPTRLYVDAHTEDQWRDKDFHPVVGDKPHDLLLTMVTDLPGIESGLQDQYDSEYSRVCIASTEKMELKKYTKLNPAGRMPLGFPALSKEEVKTLADWISKGASGPETLSVERLLRETMGLKEKIQTWETFFNGTTLKQKLVARYFYEHLFLAHIYFKQNPAVNFRLVRSKTKEGDIQEIGTEFPFSDPNSDFFYRLRPVVGTLTHKNHIPFLFSDQRLQQWRRQFLEAPWKRVPRQLPPYGAPGSNPFDTFKHIPVQARYRLFLENSNYFIMTFIKGPVCRGQTALNVINDHFWVLFLDPKYDALVNSPETYDRVSQQIQFPAKLNGDFEPFKNFKRRYWDSVKTKFDFMAANRPLSLDAIWSGDQSNPNANITVYRHFDSATVLHGLRGRTPKTVWVLDYHVFESIYYNLTAGYNVFGPLLHQVNSRVYMEVSRVASEDLFLSFLPSSRRIDLRNKWNISVPDKKESLLKSLVDLFSEDAQEKLTKKLVFGGSNVKSEVSLKQDFPKREFLDVLIQRRFSAKQTMREKFHDSPFDAVNNLPAEVAEHLPDAMLILTGDSDQSQLWTMIHNKDHYNVAMLFFEDLRRRPEHDSIDVIEGAATSYANLIIDLRDKEIRQFSEDLSQAKTPQAAWEFMKKYGLSRSDKNFWQVYALVVEKVFDPATKERGYIDLNRYINL